MIAFRVLAVVAALFATFTCAAASPLTQRGYGSAYFKIKVPAAPKPPGARGIRPLYVSPSTKSFAISTDGLSPVVANVNPSTGYATVTVAHIPAGTHNFEVTAYDRLGGKGTALSAGNSGPVDVPAAGYAYVYLTLGGVVASVALVLDYPNPTRGSPAVINLNVIAKDPDGNVILPPPGGSAEPYTRPFTLTTSDAVNGKLSATTVDQSTGSPNGFRVSVAYSGAAVPKIVFSATGGGLTSKTVTPATLVPISPPLSGEQLIAQQYDDPVTSFSTTASHQLLATIGSKRYDSIAADDTTALIYLENSVYPKTSIDIFATSGSYGPSDSVAVPNVLFGGIAVDSARSQLFVAMEDTSATYISVFSTSAGHALLGKIPYKRPGIPSLSVDSTSGRLYAAGCTGPFACTTGFDVFNTVAPYQKLGSYGQKLGTSYCAIAVDSVTERLFLSECNLSTLNPGYVDVYEASDLNARIARFVTATAGAQIAIDSKARALYATNLGPDSTYDRSVDIYAIDSGFSLVGSFPVRSVDHITVAPYGK